MTTSAQPREAPQAPRRTDLAKRLDDVGWGLFLLVTGGFWLLGDRLPDGAWLTTIGVLLIALTGVRHRAGVHPSALMLILGVLALAGGVAALTHATLPLLEVSFVAVGAYLLLRPLVRRTGE